MIVVVVMDCSGSENTGNYPTFCFLSLFLFLFSFLLKGSGPGAQLGSRGLEILHVLSFPYSQPCTVTPGGYAESKRDHLCVFGSQEPAGEYM